MFSINFFLIFLNILYLLNLYSQLIKSILIVLSCVNPDKFILVKLVQCFIKLLPIVLNFFKFCKFILDKLIH